MSRPYRSGKPVWIAFLSLLLCSCSESFDNQQASAEARDSSGSLDSGSLDSGASQAQRSPDAATADDESTLAEGSATDSGVLHEARDAASGDDASDERSNETSTSPPNSTSGGASAPLPDGGQSCASGFYCSTDSKCLDESELCNGVVDCGNAFDERAPLCSESNCDGFWCGADGRCLNSRVVCNGVEECSDPADEADCELVTCDGFWCAADEKCLSAEFQCDAFPDCSDGADESTQCEDNCQGLYCQNPTGDRQHCQPQYWLCDGTVDCADGDGNADEPEELCALNVCDASRNVFCPAPEDPEQGVCLPGLWVCDGHDDCLDGSDEMSCRNFCERQSDRYWCAPEARCLYAEAICDGIADCSDFSDERDCKEKCEGTPDAPNGKFWCEAGGCIEAGWRCNGVAQCPFGDSDERDCD